MSGYTWAIGEQDIAFVAYCLSFAAVLPTINSGSALSLSFAAAVALGASDRQNANDPKTRAQMAADVSAALSESREGPAAGEVAEPPDGTEVALAAYAEGVGDTLDALEAVLTVERALISSSLVGGTLTRLSSWLSARRAAAPRRPMTAGEVLDRVEAWHTHTPLTLPGFLADLRREIAAR